MKNTTDIDILVSEVGPRDGLQSVKASMPTALKLQWLSALAGAGLKAMDITGIAWDPLSGLHLSEKLALNYIMTIVAA
mgnify:CR=1 FL=1